MRDNKLPADCESPEIPPPTREPPNEFQPMLPPTGSSAASDPDFLSIARITSATDSNIPALAAALESSPPVAIGRIAILAIGGIAIPTAAGPGF